MSMPTPPLSGRLPPLRQDLGIHAAPATLDGAPSWHLHDPAANVFYQIGWPAFEILSRWSLGDPAQIVDAIHQETTLEIDIDTIKSVVDFLERHHLLEGNDARHTATLTTALKARKQHWAKWLMHNYLFFRLPLFRPDTLLARGQRWLPLFLDQRFWLAAGILALVAGILVIRQWEQLLHGFTEYSGPETLIAFGLALTVAKVAHEFGHGLVAKYHGCKVPTMGVAFLVLWPVLYTDTNEAWKLPSHRARFQIALSGMAAESLVAILATWAWLLLPEGPAKAAALFLATTSWLMTLALNASPFMRFDGYFLLVDTLGIPNLHARAFALGRWWLRERLFGWGDAPPESFSRSRQSFMIAFAIATWLYRFLLFLSIALLVYHAFFKALGILLMLVEIGWFILRPIANEIEAWRKRKEQIVWNPATRRLSIGLSLLLIWLALPWQTEIRAPGILAPAAEQHVYAPMAAVIAEYPAADKQGVSNGELLIRLDAPELMHRLTQATVQENHARQQLEQQAFSDALIGRGDVLRHQWSEANARLGGLHEESKRLELRAHGDGEIAFRAEDLAPGTWVTPKEKLLTVVDRRSSTVDAYIGESDLPRLHAGGQARFVPESGIGGRRTCQVGEIENVNAAIIEDPELASTHGGPLPTRIDRSGNPIPAAPIYRIRLTGCKPALAPTVRLRGTVHVEAEGRSLLVAGMTKVISVLVRESGF
ncbi:MAG: HlyD family efflux transporter periplasmic adaptor subunit [Dechloromonas sp.]|nr:HlyD family efflux transporter periplasmic adaptor subunit [Dechloromonas sp.]